MSSSGEAVAKTLRYAAFFHSRLDDKELHHWLISAKTYSPSFLQKYYPQKRHFRPTVSSAKINLAKKVARFLSFFPTISLVAITGSLAINNAQKEDDIDLMIITRQDTLWLTRLFVIPLISFFFKRRTPAAGRQLPAASSNALCLNLWLDQAALAVPLAKRNLYTAHEVLQVKPLLDRRRIYQEFILANAWTKNYLANAYKLAQSNFPFPSLGEGGIPTAASGVGEVFLRFLNSLAYLLQYLYMKRKITHETVSLHSAYFHPRDLSPALDKYLYRI